MSERELKKETKRAFRTIMREMSNTARFDAPDEIKILNENFEIARHKAVVGGLVGASACGLGWRYTMGTRLAPLIAVWGGIAGMTYGMFAVRQKLFLDLLSIPEDRSPFATQARHILLREMPASPIHTEIRRRQVQRFHSPAHVDSELVWTDAPPFIETDPATPPGSMYDIVTGTTITQGRTIKENDQNTLPSDNEEEVIDKIDPSAEPEGRKQTTWEEIRRRRSGRNW